MHQQRSGRRWRWDESVKKVAITFDDGPNPDYTEMLLAGLKERGVSATFFLLGKEVEQYPEIVKKIHEGGHLIGTHSYEHVNLSNLTDAAAIEQVDKTNAAIHEIIGEFPEYIRPPFGCWKPNLDYETTMIEVLWDVDQKTGRRATHRSLRSACWEMSGRMILFCFMMHRSRPCWRHLRSSMN